MGKKWSKAQHTKYRATLLRKIQERNVVQTTPTTIDTDSIRHIINGVWESLSLTDEVKAIDSLYFDPLNPEGV